MNLKDTRILYYSEFIYIEQVFVWHDLCYQIPNVLSVDVWNKTQKWFQAFNNRIV